MLARLDKVENFEHLHDLLRVTIFRGLLLTLTLNCEVASEQYHISETKKSQLETKTSIDVLTSKTRCCVKYVLYKW